ncbi:MAG: phosphorylase family protein [Solirubrobacterales bacterium]
MSIHLRPSSPIAPDVLVPGDPGRAMALAQQLLVKPVMHNLHRGLWGYSGETEAGRPLSVQSTGMGAPSAAIVLHELAGLGAQRAIRVGTCGALDPELELGALVRAETAVGDDGVCRALGVEEPLRPDPALLGALAEAGAGRPARVVTTDFFYEHGPQPRERWTAAGAQAVDMETAALFALGPRMGLATAALLVVSDVFPEGERLRVGDEQLARAAEEMGRAAAAALG